MSVVLVWAERVVDRRPESVFALLGTGQDCGWIFGLRLDSVAVGSVVTLQVPVDGPDRPTVELLGRISAVRAPSRIEIVHHQPWQGRIRILIDPDKQNGSRVRLVGEVENASLEWLLRRRGHDVKDENSESYRIGLLTSKSGSASVFAAASEFAARLALEEANDCGGVLGVPVNILVGDDRTDPATGAQEAERLARQGCDVVLATTTSATFDAAAAGLRSSGVPLIHTPMNEGGNGGSQVLRLGERPFGQLLAVSPMLATSGSKRWYLAGNDYVWPRAVHQAARQVVPEHSGEIVGEAYAPLGTKDFTLIIERILDAKADTVLSSFVGSDLVAFERQCHEMGVREHCRSVALALDEPTRERIGDYAALGMFGVSGYFAEVDTDQNGDFLDAYRRKYGPFAPPVSSISESVYEAVHLVVDDARRRSSSAPRCLAQGLLGRRFDFPRGTVSVTDSDDLKQQLFVAQARIGGFELRTAALVG